MGVGGVREGLIERQAFSFWLLEPRGIAARRFCTGFAVERRGRLPGAGLRVEGSLGGSLRG